MFYLCGCALSCEHSIIGEDKTLSIKLGADAGDATTEDIIVVRGISADVNRAVKEIEQIVEAAKNDEIINSYVRASPAMFNCFFLISYSVD